MPYMAWWMRRSSSSLHSFRVWAMRAFVCSDWSLLLGFYLVMQAERDSEREGEIWQGKWHCVYASMRMSIRPACVCLRQRCCQSIRVSSLSSQQFPQLQSMYFSISLIASTPTAHTLTLRVHRMHICSGAPSTGTECCTKRAFLAQFALFTRIHLWAR